MVLRSMPSPAWLGPDAPDGDVVISTRTRFARNLVGFRFPASATIDELRSIQNSVIDAAVQGGLGFEVYRRPSEAERDYMIGCRLLSPDFQAREPGRVVLLDEGRYTSIMVNEEDHLRIQALTAGWSPHHSHHLATFAVDTLGRSLKFAWHKDWGYLTASPFNAGPGRRFSAMFHLIGLAHTKRLPAVLQALALRGLTTRGLFGESSRAVGAFFQVSSHLGDLPPFQGACDYLLREERLARSDVSREQILEKASSAAEFAITSMEISLADALRVLAWARWAAATGASGFPTSIRRVDEWMSQLEVRGTMDTKAANRYRATYLRARLEGE